MKEKLLLIDGHSILNRAFYGVPDFTNSEGLHTNAVYGFLNIMFKVLDEEKPTHLVVAFDLSAPTFRHKMYKEYKGTRKPMLDELRQQVPVIKDLLTAMGIKICTLEGYEADDILGTLSKRGEKLGMEVTVLSGDRDLLQLASDHIKISIPKTKKGGTEVENYYAAQVVEKYKVTPVEFIDVKALMGDSSDNIPGVPGIGEKGATSLIEEYGSIENAYANVESIKNSRCKNALREHFDMAQMSKILATININSPVNIDISDGKLQDIFTEEALNFVKRLEFKSMLPKFENVNVDLKLEEYFKTTSDLNEAENYFLKAEKSENCGVYIAKNQNEIVGVALAISDEEIAYIECQWFITSDYLENKLKELVEKSQSLTFINVKDDLNILKASEDSHLFDAGLAAYLLNPLKENYSYDDLAKDYLGIQIPSYSEIFVKKKEEQDADCFMRYACYNAYVLQKIKNILENRLEETGMLLLYRQLEFPLIFALYDMEVTGVKVEKEELLQYSLYLGEHIKKIQEKIYEQAGEEFNINSPKQLGSILFEKLEIPYGKKTKTGYSTSADILEKLKTDYPIVSDILEYRTMSKLKSTYADGLVQYIAEDGRIHGKFNQTVTATGRISSTDPNLQNIPVRIEMGRKIRKVFVPKEDCVFIDADYSQIELRILAHMSEDENLIRAYEQSLDIHQATASKVFNIPLEQVTKEMRSNAKAVNFGIVYGISAYGLSQDLNISKKQAEQYIDDYFLAYPKIKEFLDKTVAKAKEDGYTLTLFNRRRPIPELKSSNFMQRSFGERAAMNSPIQGTAADIMKIAALNVFRSFNKHKLKSKIVLQVHDELLVEAYKDEIEQVKTILETEMKNAANLLVELKIGLSEGMNWYEAH